MTKRATFGRAIKSGGNVPARYNLFIFRDKPIEKLSVGESVCRFIEDHIPVPEGAKVGQPLILEDFQVLFILCVFGYKPTSKQASRAILAIARKNGKTALIAALVICALVGPIAQQNAQIVSGAMSRDQAAMVFKAAAKMINLSAELQAVTKVIESKKQILGKPMGTEYIALAAEGSTAQGLSPILAILDESGQVKGPTSDFISAILTSQGAHEDPLVIIISTQASSDADFLSVQIDDATKSGDKSIVCHVYAADDKCDLLDKKQWRFANPALGKFRSLKDLEKQLIQASRLPSMENSARNLLLNNRISQETLWLAPEVWKSNSSEPDWDTVRANGCTVGLDLSKKNDLTVALVSAKDDEGCIHIFPFGFTPLSGLEERSRRDRVPYDVWVRDGILTGVPGKTIDYEWVAAWLKVNLIDDGIDIKSIEFDRWRIMEFKAACSREGVELGEDQWHEVGQGYKDQSPRIEALETELLKGKVKHGNHPVLNLGAASAIAIKDPSGNRKLDKMKSGAKIDATVAMVMAVYPLINPEQQDYSGDISWLVG